VCLHLARWLRPSHHQGIMDAVMVAVLLFMFVMVGVPILIVVGGHLTGALPMPSLGPDE